MFERTVSAEDLARLKREREDADRAYNDALTRLDRALPRPFQPPAAPPAPGHSGPPDVGAPAARLWQAPDPEAPRRFRWLHRLLQPVVGSAFERQEHVNRASLDRIAQQAAATDADRRYARQTQARIANHLAESLTFQSRLLQYLQQITPFADTKDREVAGMMRRINEDNGAAIAGLTAGIEALASRQSGLRESVQVLHGATRVTTREIHRLRDRLGAGATPDSVSPTLTGSAPPDTPGAAQPPAPPESGSPTYAVFEDTFRGSHADIASRQRRYLACFEGASGVLDIGCGRGEFLELLRDSGVPARGIDANPEMVERCRERGLDATRADALAYVAALPDESLGGLFAAQVVEHLEADYLLQLLASLHRALAPGTRIVLETINAGSWMAFFSAYLRDITHRHPLHPDTLSYLLRAHGFVDVEVVYSGPVPEASRLQRVRPETASGDASLRALLEAFNGNVDRLNGLLFADQDYAAVATRA